MVGVALTGVQQPDELQGVHRDGPIGVELDVGLIAE
jgi:hypothetical protein